MKNARIIFIILISSIAILEIALRIFSIFPTDSDLFINDPDIGHRMRPHLAIRDNLQTNTSGFNDSEHIQYPEENHTRIAIIGDSFVFGAVPREKNFTTVLQGLADSAGASVDILNMGLPAAGPRNYLALLKNDAVHMNVDIVCVVFFVGNDIIESHPDFKTVIWLGSPREILRKPYLFKFSKEYFYIYRMVRLASRLMRERLDKTPRPSWSEATFLGIENQRSEIFKIEKRSYIEQSYDETPIILKELSSEAERLQKKLVVVLAPDELQINPELRVSWAEEYDIIMDEYNFVEPQNMITNELRRLNISVVDLLPGFQNEAQQKVLYIKQDTHWNTDGNRLAAEIIWAYLNND